MAVSFQLCVLFIFSFVYVKSGVLTGKAFFCRDPDTGRLHSVNSTWQSTTFCGNYTCKLKHKNNSSINPEIFRKFYITNITESHENTGNNSVTNITKILNKEKHTILNLPSLLHIERKSNENEDIKNDNNSTDDSDRYLTETEIKTISEILHTVKKSDLDAIVDVYNLAQNIYKEIDTETTENPNDETLSSLNNPNDDHKHMSYWYEPLHDNNNKGKAVDMQVAGSNTVNKVQSKKENPNSYFGGNIEATDFRKLPYYYPISSFQRMASYTSPQQYAKAKTEKASYKTQGTGINQINLDGIKVPGYILNNPYAGETQKMIQPSVLLPYPFSYIHHYNISSYPYNLNFGNYPWMSAGLNKNNYLQASQKVKNAALPQQIPVVEETDTSLLEDNLLEDLAKRDKKPEWQTEQLASQILDEVKANVDKSMIIKAFPFRKKVKLEKVGKVIKLDEIRRPKRADDSKSDEHQDSREAELFEVVLERTTCRSDLQTGFFKIGNLSHPFPECCPQKIKPKN